MGAQVWPCWISFLGPEAVVPENSGKISPVHREQVTTWWLLWLVGKHFLEKMWEHTHVTTSLDWWRLAWKCEQMPVINLLLMDWYGLVKRYSSRCPNYNTSSTKFKSYASPFADPIQAWKALESDWPGKSCIWLAKADGSGVTDYLEVLSGQSMAQVVDD